MNRLSIPGAYPRGSERAEGQGPAVVTSDGGIPGREAGLLGAAAVPAPAISNVFTYFVRWARFAGYVGLLAIIVVSLVPGEWRPSIGWAKALEHGIAYSIVAAFLTLAGRARWPQILLLVALAGRSRSAKPGSRAATPIRSISSVARPERCSALGSPRLFSPGCLAFAAGA